VLTVWRSVRSILASSFKAIWKELWTILVVNGLWLIANLLIFPGPPATLALHWYSNQLAHEEAVDHTDYWHAIKRFFKLGWRWGIANLLIVAFLVGDYWITYQAQDFSGKKLVLGLYVALLIFWLLMQFYALPFLFEQTELKLSQAWNNALVLISRNLPFVIILALSVSLIMVLGTLLFLFSVFFGPVFLSLAGNFAVQDRLQTNQFNHLSTEG
jgi:uncharacterized membrane protein YesL